MTRPSSHRRLSIRNYKCRRLSIEDYTVYRKGLTNSLLKHFYEIKFDELQHEALKIASDNVILYNAYIYRGAYFILISLTIRAKFVKLPFVKVSRYTIRTVLIISNG